MKLYNEDCIVQMQKMIDEGVQVDSVVTDPPYELGFMGKSWDSTGIAFQKETWELAFQLLKPGGHLLAFAGSRTYHRIAVAIEDAGFEIRDQIMWLYGSGFPKTKNHLKPAHEPIVMARKPLEGTVAENVLKHGTGGINIDECRIELSEGDDPRLGGKGSFKTDKAGNDVYSLGYRGEETTTSELGRFPANVMHDGLEQEWARYFYCPKVSKNERNRGCDGLPFGEAPASARSKPAPGRKKALGEPRRNTHPTVKPVELMKYLCRLITPKGGTVLDPFMGSGSTGMAAVDEGFDFLGIEKEEEYFKIAKNRIDSQSPLMKFL